MHEFGEEVRVAGDVWFLPAKMRVRPQFGREEVGGESDVLALHHDPQKLQGRTLKKGTPEEKQQLKAQLQGQEKVRKGDE